MTIAAFVLSAVRRTTHSEKRCGLMALAFASGRITTQHAAVSDVKQSISVFGNEHFEINTCSSRRWNSAAGSSNTDIQENENVAPDTTDVTTTASVVKKNKKSLQSGREKRRNFIGLAKAVDRGQWAVTYSPGGDRKSVV